MLVGVDDFTIPSTVTKMDENNYIYNIKHCRVSWTTPLEVTGLIDAGIYLDDATLHVPEGTKELYAAADSWKRFGTIVEDGGKSGIRSISNSDDLQSGVWYTLDGRQLQSKPTNKGVYIKKGCKIVIK
jgi:hypothetical protein